VLSAQLDSMLLVWLLSLSLPSLHVGQLSPLLASYDGLFWSDHGSREKGTLSFCALSKDRVQQIPQLFWVCCLQTVKRQWLWVALPGLLGVRFLFPEFFI
jgi:hypothetical protein